MESLIPMTSADIKQESDYEGQSVKKEANGEEESDLSPVIKRTWTSSTSLSYPDEDSFLYCEKCQLKYEGGCQDHGYLIYMDNAEGQSVKKEANGEEESDLSPVIKRTWTSSTSLSYPDEDSFLYCEKCQLKYEGGCQDHGYLIYMDNAEDVQDEGCSQGSSLLVQLAGRDRHGPGRKKVEQSGVCEAHSDDVGTSPKGDYTRESDHILSVCEMNTEPCVASTSCGLESKVEIKTLQEIHNAGKPFTCDVCGVGFTHSGDFKRHKSSHIGEKPYKCNVCGAGFPLSSTLKIHKRTHTGEKPYKCDVCGVAFTHCGTLKDHKRTHTGEKPYKCDVCGAGFAWSKCLKIHKIQHTGEKPYKCHVCGVGFTQSGNLKDHKRTHAGEKPYKCGVCVV